MLFRRRGVDGMARVLIDHSMHIPNPFKLHKHGDHSGGANGNVLVG